jgi:hypothetical protein
VPRLAVEATQRWSRVALSGRAGYFYEPTGARGPVLLDADRHVLTFGAGLTWTSRLTTLQFDAFVQWHHLQPNEHVSGDFASFGFSIGVDL